MTGAGTDGATPVETGGRRATREFEPPVTKGTPIGGAR